MWSRMIRSITRMLAGGLDRTLQLYVRYIVTGFLALVGLLIFGCFLNVIGLKGFNILFGLVTFIAAVIVFAWPHLFLTVVAFGVYQGAAKKPETVSEEVQKALKVYTNAFGVALVVILSIFFILGTISFQENPKALPVFALGGIILFLLSYLSNRRESSVAEKDKAKVGGAKGAPKNLMGTFVKVVFICLAFSLISGAFLYKHFGSDFRDSFSVSAVEKKIYDIVKTQKEKDDEKSLVILQDIERKIKNRQELEAWEEEFLNKAKSGRQNFGKKSSDYWNRFKGKVSDFVEEANSGERTIRATSGPVSLSHDPSIEPGYELAALIDYSPNYYTDKDQAWLEAKLEAGEYRLVVPRGSFYRQRFDEGIKRIHADGYHVEYGRTIAPFGAYRGKPELAFMPLIEAPLGSLVVRVNGKVYPLGYGVKIKTDGGPIYVTVNVPQKADYFGQNEGQFLIKVLKRTEG